MSKLIASLLSLDEPVASATGDSVTLLDLTEHAALIDSHSSDVSKLVESAAALEALALCTDSDFARISTESVFITLGLEAEEAAADKPGFVKKLLTAIAAAFRAMWKAVTGFFGKISSFFNTQDEKIEAAKEAVKADRAEAHSAAANHSGGEDTKLSQVSSGEHKTTLKLSELKIHVPAFFTVKSVGNADKLADVIKRIEELRDLSKELVVQMEHSQSLFDNSIMALRSASKAMVGADFDKHLNSVIDKLNQHSVSSTLNHLMGPHIGGINVTVSKESGATRVYFENSPLGETFELTANTAERLKFLDDLQAMNKKFMSDVGTRAERLAKMTDRLIDMLDKSIEDVIKDGLQQRIASFRKVSGVLVIILRGDTQALVRSTQLFAKAVALSTGMVSSRLAPAK